MRCVGRLYQSVDERIATLLMISITVVFMLAYAAIALEHPIGISKTASALLGATLLWTIYALFMDHATRLEHDLNETVASTAQILFFLLGAMTIVEVVDAHDGFEIITSRIRTGRLTTLLWLVAWTTFILSAILDNLTTAIVMVSLMRKLLRDTNDRLMFVSTIVIAANAGGAWSPVGDVTTTMLWIGGQITAFGIVYSLLLASVVNLAVPLCVVTFTFRRRAFEASTVHTPASTITHYERNLMFGLGLAVLIAVPVFKQITHLPPFMGVLLGLGILWLVGEIVHRHKQPALKRNLAVTKALSRIDHASLLFFVGILLAVAVLEHTEVLAALAEWLNQTVGRLDVTVLLLGFLSAIVDNVPLVAAVQGMYPLSQYPTDSFLWEFIAYCAGTGGSILIIGSAAGVAAMGIEKIQFIWYLRRIAGLATLGYVAGAAAYLGQYTLLK